MASAHDSVNILFSTPSSGSATSNQSISPGINNNCVQAFSFQLPGDASPASINDVEKDFMEYVMSFPLPLELLSNARTKNTQGESIPKVGLDHLDNLCKLLEQLSDLKEANIRLKKRVQYLEDIKTMHQIHKEMFGEREKYSFGLSEEEVRQLDESTMRAEDSEEEQVLGLYRSKTTNLVSPTNESKCGDKSRCATISKERRERSKSVGHSCHGKAKNRPSRWSKVKEVLGIEKTYDFLTEKADNLARKEVLNKKGKSCRSHSNIPSSRNLSSTERPALNTFTGPKKTPWGKMKTMIQMRRDNRESSSSSPRDEKPNTTSMVDKYGQRARSAFQDVEIPPRPKCGDRSLECEMKKGSECERKSERDENGRIQEIGKRKKPMKHAAEEEMCAGLSPRSERKWLSKVKGVLARKKEASTSSSPAECLDSGKGYKENSSISPPEVNILSSPLTTATELLGELHQNLSDEFNRKLEEWQRCQAEGLHKIPCQEEDSFGRVRKVSSTTEKWGNLQKKDLSWLEKEQQKVEREIDRLSKEKQKFEKRSVRLRQLKESMNDGYKKEVLVKTSAGEFRFEGISDDFTKKLYEWETKKGVNPELSTIALLDESLKFPSIVTPLGSNSTRQSPEPSKICYQVSRASSEPDLSATQKETSSNQGATLRSKSGDKLLSGETVANFEVDNASATDRDTIQHSDDNYSLLEEKMYLLDQLKEKEEFCSHLQNELERLDDKTEKNNRTHQEELERYRKKLWEIHMSRPRDLQGSLHLISELKSRIDVLQKCSDKLKSDRERLEESFQYHSNQQARLADDLIRKVQDFQDTTGMPWSTNRGYRRKWRKLIKCDHDSISKIHHLSTKLLQQARDVEQTLMERTRHVCHLRWEILHRDMSAVLLQAALHRVTSQPVSILSTWDKRRNRFKNIKAWSADTTTSRPCEDPVSDDWFQRQLSITPYNDWASIDFSPNDLMTTAHELKKETLRLAISRPDKLSDSEDKKSATCSAESEMADSDRYYDTGSAVNSRSSSFSSGPGGLRGSHSDTRLYERTPALRRNSSSSISCVEASDSSSIHDSDKVQMLLKKFPWRTQWRSLDNVSSSCSSRSSVLDDDTNKSHGKAALRKILPQEESSHVLQVKYGSFEEDSEVYCSSHCNKKCLTTPKPEHTDTEFDENAQSPFHGGLRDGVIQIYTTPSKPNLFSNIPSYDSTGFSLACQKNNEEIIS